MLLEGVPGVAKTLLVRSAGRGARRRHQAGAVHPRPDARRHHRLAGLRRRTPASSSFREGPVFTNLLLADEINRTPPKTQAALLEAMEERQVSVDGAPRPLPQPFMVAATQNPVEYEGTYPAARGPARPVPAQGRAAPAAARGRGARCCAGTPPASTRATCARPGLRPVAGPADLAPGAEAVRAVTIAPEVAGYIVDIARATRQSPSLSLGVSPRGATALMATSRAWAWLNGRTSSPPTTSRRSPTRPSRTGCRCGRRPSSRASTWAPCWPAPARPYPSRADHGRSGRPAPGRPMALTGRVPLLLLLGLVPVVLARRAAHRAAVVAGHGGPRRRSTSLLAAQPRAG